MPPSIATPLSSGTARYVNVGGQPDTYTDPSGLMTVVESNVQLFGQGYNIALHGPHHDWKFGGKKLWCDPIQRLTFAVGVKGSHPKVQIPLPFCK
jgi:hypothetical protein